MAAVKAGPNPAVLKLDRSEAARALKLVSELVLRRTDALRLYKPMPSQLEFHKSQAMERLLIGSNRSGKTFSAAVECAWAARGEHPYLEYPKGDMEIYCVAKDERQIAEVWWKKLTKAGCGKQWYMVPDPATGEWRTYNQSEDLELKHLRRKVPPLIPRRYWAGEPVWATKKGDCPKMLTLKNGTKIHFFTANGKPPQGTSVDLCLFDEEVEDSQWYEEMAARLVDYEGRFIWSATPQAGSEALWDLHQRAEDEEESENPTITEHFCHIDNNPYVSTKAKESLKLKFSSPDAYQVRIEGKFASQQHLIYPEFSMAIHGIDDFEIPKSWTRYMVVDPGQQCQCTLLFAVPEMTRPFDSPLPDKWIEPSTELIRPLYGDFVYLYREIYTRPCLTADQFASAAQRFVQDDHFWEFIIDGHAGRQTNMGSNGQSVEAQYRNALHKLGISSNQTGYGFIYGVDDIKSGNMAVHDWLYTRPSDMQTKFRVFRSCVNFKTQMERYRKKKVKDHYVDDPVKKNDDGPDGLRYFRGRDPKWHSLPDRKKPVNRVYENLMKTLKARHKKPGSSGYINLGPSRHSNY